MARSEACPGLTDGGVPVEFISENFGDTACNAKKRVLQSVSPHRVDVRCLEADELDHFGGRIN